LHKRFSILLILLLTLSACNLPRNQTTPVATAASGQETAAPAESAAPSDTPAPSATSAPSKLLLLALPGSEAAQATALQDTLQTLAQDNGLTLETRTDLPSADLQSEARYVVILPPDPGVANLAKANPNTQFLALGMPEAPAGGNISVAGGGDQAADQQAFVAGYMAAVITNDWRVGVISRSDTPQGLAARNGFINGAVFYCGLCRPAFPPFVQYPVFAEVTGSASSADLQAAADTLIANGVQTIFVSPGINDGALFEYLAGKNINIIGVSSPASSVASRWVASVRADESAAVKAIFERWLKGETGIQISAPLALTDVNPALLSPGRQRLVDELVTELLSGGVDTGVNPATGEMK
jgi:hypothetical protein